MFRRSKVAFVQGSVLLAASLLFGRERCAFAESALEPVALSYQAPEMCPSFEGFLAEVQRSTPRLRLARPGEAARRFEVIIEASGTEGQLRLDGGSRGQRSVSGRECRAVAELLAFAVALAADPDAQPVESAPAVAAFPPANPPPASPEPATTPAAAPVVVEPRAHAPPRTSAARWQWSLAGAGFGTGVSSPAITWGGGAFGELGLNSVAWAPRLRLGVNYARKTVEAVGAPGVVALTTAFLSLETCAGALRRGGITFLPCLRAQGGTRDAQGLDPLPGAAEVLRGFLDLGVASHLRLRFAGPAFLELGMALMFPTVRDQVKILPDTLVYEVPAVGIVGEGALGVEFGDQNSD